MSSRDERGNYVNDKAVVIKVSEYSDGSGVKIDFYDKSPSEPDINQYIRILMTMEHTAQKIM